MPREVPPHHHLDRKWLGPQANRNPGMRGTQPPIGDNIRGRLQKMSCGTVQDFPFVGYGRRQNHIKGRNTIRGDHNQMLIAQAIHITDFATVETGDALQGQRSLRRPVYHA